MSDTNDELPSVTLIRFYGLLDPDAGPDAAKLARKLRRDETRAALTLRVLMAARGGRPLADTEMSTAEHRAEFVRGHVAGRNQRRGLP